MISFLKFGESAGKLGIKVGVQKFLRSESGVRFLRRINKIPSQPPKDFDTIYTYALVEWSEYLPEPIVKLFRSSDMKKIVRKCLDDGDLAELMNSVESDLPGPLEVVRRRLDYNPVSEIQNFSKVLTRVISRSRYPHEVQLANEVHSIAQDMQSLKRLYETGVHRDTPSELRKLLGMFSGGRNLPGQATFDMPRSVQELGTDNVVYNRLIQQMIEDIKSRINSGYVRDAGVLTSELIQSDGFENLSREYQISILFYGGLVHLEMHETGTVEETLSKMSSLQPDANKVFELKVKLACELQDRQMFENVLNQWTRAGLSPTDRTVKKCLFELKSGNADEVIATLAELGIIRDSFKNNEDALQYLGSAFMQKGMFHLARTCYVQANTITEFPYRHYLITLCDVLPILIRPGSVHMLSEAERLLIKKAVEALEGLEPNFSQRQNEVRIGFYSHLLNLRLFLQPSRVITDINSLPTDIVDSDEIQLMLAEAYFLVGTFDNAMAIYQQLYSSTHNPELLIKIIASLFDQKDFEGIIQFAASIPYAEYDSRGIVAGILLESINQVSNNTDDMLEKIKELEEMFGETPIFCDSVARIAWDLQRQDLAEQYLERSIAAIKEDDDPHRLQIFRTCEMMGFTDRAINVLMPMARHSRVARDRALALALDSDDDTHLALAQQLINDARDSDDLVVLQAKCQLALNQNRLSDALASLIELFDVHPDITSAYNIVAIKLQTDDIPDIQRYVEYLEKSDNPRAVMMAAGAHGYMHRSAAAEMCSYKAITLLSDEFDEPVFLQYLMMHFRNPSGSSNTQSVIEHDNVVEDSVIELRDPSGNTIFICLDSNIEPSEGRPTAFGCTHYGLRSRTALSLIQKPRFSTVEYDGILYTIQSITNKHVFAFRYCLDTYTQRCPNSKYIKAITISSDNPVQSLIPLLESSRQHSEFMLNQYNMANRIGLSVVTLSHGGYDSYLETVVDLLNAKDQIYYAGEVSSVVSDSQPVVLDLSALVILQLLGRLSLLNQLPNRILITKSLQDTIQQIFSSATISASSASGTISLQKDGMPLYIPYTQEAKQRLIEFWREISTVVGNITVVDRPRQFHPDSDLSELVSEVQLDTLNLAQEVNGIAVCDDLFIRKVASTFYSGTVMVNSVWVLDLLQATPAEYLHVVLQLSKFKYLFCCSTESLLKIIHECVLSSPFLVGEGTKVAQFSELISNLFSTPALLLQYFPIIKNVLDVLYQERINVNVDTIMHIIIQNLVKSCKAFNVSLGTALNVLAPEGNLDQQKRMFIGSLLFRNTHVVR